MRAFAFALVSMGWVLDTGGTTWGEAGVIGSNLIARDISLLGEGGITIDWEVVPSIAPEVTRKELVWGTSSEKKFWVGDWSRVG